LLSGGAGASQRELSRPAHAARRARLFAELSAWERTGMAATQGGRAALWLSAVPTEGDGRWAIPGAAMRVAVRVWLGAAPRPVPPRPHCRCGGAVDAAGRHFLSACPEQAARCTALHHFLVGRVAAALRRSPAWGEVTVEEALPAGTRAVRPDLRATAAATGAVTWGDVSVARVWRDDVALPVRTTPLRPVAAARREMAKRAKYVPALPVSNPPHSFTPLVWEALGRVGPATDAWLKAALAGPQLAVVRASLLMDVSVALWRSVTWAVASGYASSFAGVGAMDVEDEGASGAGGVPERTSLVACLVGE